MTSGSRTGGDRYSLSPGSGDPLTSWKWAPPWKTKVGEMCHSLNNWCLKHPNVFLQAFGSQVSDKGECTNREELQLKVKEKHAITVHTVICKLVFLNDLTMLWSFLQNTFSSRPFRYSSRYFCGSKAEDDFVVAEYNTFESVKHQITCNHRSKICAENMWVLNTDVSRPGAKAVLVFYLCPVPFYWRFFWSVLCLVDWASLLTWLSVVAGPS